MLTVTNIVSRMAAIVTPTVNPAASSTHDVQPLGECGEVNVFYTGFPPYHPLVEAQGWDPVRVDVGLRNDTQNLMNAGYNVHFVWAGPEISITVMEDRLKQKGVDFDLVGIGWGMRGAIMEIIVRRFEILVDMYKRNVPELPIVFNYNPESMIWSVDHKLPMRENCAAIGKPGNLLGYEEICDERCDIDAKKTHDEL